MNIEIASGPFSFNGPAEDAHEFTIHTRRAFEESELIVPNYLTDFVFAIEVELQRVGYLTEDFEVSELTS